MQRDFSLGLNIYDVVAESELSQAGLERAFKRELGITPGVCLRQIRMKEAARLLAQTDEKVSEVGRMVGMVETKHFSTMFKKHFNISPRAYRQEMRRKKSIVVDFPVSGKKI